MSNHYVIQLRVELKNPHPDRSSPKDWNKRPTIPAGTRFIVQYDSLYETNQRFGGEYINSELGRLITANSKHVEPVSLREIQVVDADYDYDYRHSLIEAWLEMGRLTRQDFRDARDFLSAKYAAEEAAAASPAHKDEGSQAEFDRYIAGDR